MPAPDRGVPGAAPGKTSKDTSGYRWLRRPAAPRPAWHEARDDASAASLASLMQRLTTATSEHRKQPPYGAPRRAPSSSATLVDTATQQRFKRVDLGHHGANRKETRPAHTNTRQKAAALRIFNDTFDLSEIVPGGDASASAAPAAGRGRFGDQHKGGMPKGTTTGAIFNHSMEECRGEVDDDDNERGSSSGGERSDDGLVAFEIQRRGVDDDLREVAPAVVVPVHSGTFASVYAQIQQLWRELKISPLIISTFVIRHVAPVLGNAAWSGLPSAASSLSSPPSVGREIRGKDTSFHRHHLSVHLALLEKERELVLAACGRIDVRERSMVVLKELSDKYTNWSGNRLVASAARHHAGTTNPLPGASSMIASTSSVYASLDLLLQDVHAQLDAYRAATVAAVESVLDWRRFITNHSFVGVPPTASADAEAAVEACGGSDGRADRLGATPNYADPGTARGLLLSWRQEQQRLDTLARRCDAFKWRGHDFLRLVLRDLHVMVFHNAPLRYLVGLDFDWNPLALPGRKWSVLYCMSAASRALHTHRSAGRPHQAPCTEAAGEASRRRRGGSVRSVFAGAAPRDVRECSEVKQGPPSVTAPRPSQQRQLAPGAASSLIDVASVKATLTMTPIFRREFLRRVAAARHSAAVSAGQSRADHEEASRHSSDTSADEVVLSIDDAALLARCEDVFMRLHSHFVQTLARAQACVKGAATRAFIRQQLSAAVRIQCAVRRFAACSELRRRQRAAAARRLAPVVRGALSRMRMRDARQRVMLLQRCSRGFMSRQIACYRLAALNTLKRALLTYMLRRRGVRMRWLQRISLLQRAGRAGLKRKRLQEHRRRRIFKALQVELQRTHLTESHERTTIVAEDEAVRERLLWWFWALYHQQALIHQEASVRAVELEQEEARERRWLGANAQRGVEILLERTAQENERTRIANAETLRSLQEAAAQRAKLQELRLVAEAHRRDFIIRSAEVLLQQHRDERQAMFQMEFLAPAFELRRFFLSEVIFPLQRVAIDFAAVEALVVVLQRQEHAERHGILAMLETSMPTPSSPSLAVASLSNLTVIAEATPSQVAPCSSRDAAQAPALPPQTSHDVSDTTTVVDDDAAELLCLVASRSPSCSAARDSVARRYPMVSKVLFQGRPTALRDGQMTNDVSPAATVNEQATSTSPIPAVCSAAVGTDAHRADDNDSKPADRAPAKVDAATSRTPTSSPNPTPLQVDEVDTMDLRAPPATSQAHSPLREYLQEQRQQQHSAGTALQACRRGFVARRELFMHTRRQQLNDARADNAAAAAAAAADITFLELPTKRDISTGEETPNGDCENANDFGLMLRALPLMVRRSLEAHVRLIQRVGRGQGPRRLAGTAHRSIMHIRHNVVFEEMQEWLVRVEEPFSRLLASSVLKRIRLGDDDCTENHELSEERGTTATTTTEPTAASSKSHLLYSLELQSAAAHFSVLRQTFTIVTRLKLSFEKKRQRQRVRVLAAHGVLLPFLKEQCCARAAKVKKLHETTNALIQMQDHVAHFLSEVLPQEERSARQLIEQAAAVSKYRSKHVRLLQRLGRFFLLRCRILQERQLIAQCEQRTRLELVEALHRVVHVVERRNQLVQALQNMRVQVCDGRRRVARTRILCCLASGLVSSSLRRFVLFLVAATRIQRWYRSQRHKGAVSRAHCRDAAARRITRAFRIRAAQRYVECLRKQKLEHRAAVRLAFALTTLRRCITRFRDGLRERRRREQAQDVVRSRGCGSLEDEKDAVRRVEVIMCRHTATAAARRASPHWYIVLLQAAFRRFLARKACEKMRNAKVAARSSARRAHAERLLRTWVAGNAARWRARRGCRSRTPPTPRAAAQVIYRCMLSFSCRRRLMRGRAQRHERIRCCAARKLIERSLLQWALAQRRRRGKQQAGVVHGCFARVAARAEPVSEGTPSAAAATEVHRTISAVVIQTCYRRHAAARFVDAVRRERIERRDAATQRWAAQAIAACWRRRRSATSIHGSSCHVSSNVADPDRLVQLPSVPYFHIPHTDASFFDQLDGGHSAGSPARSTNEATQHSGNSDIDDEEFALLEAASLEGVSDPELIARLARAREVRERRRPRISSLAPAKAESSSSADRVFASSPQQEGQQRKQPASSFSYVGPVIKADEAPIVPIATTRAPGGVSFALDLSAITHREQHQQRRTGETTWDCDSGANTTDNAVVERVEEASAGGEIDWDAVIAAPRGDVGVNHEPSAKPTTPGTSSFTSVATPQTPRLAALAAGAVLVGPRVRVRQMPIEQRSPSSNSTTGNTVEARQGDGLSSAIGAAAAPAPPPSTSRLPQHLLQDVARWESEAKALIRQRRSASNSELLRAAVTRRGASSSSVSGDTAAQRTSGGLQEGAERGAMTASTNMSVSAAPPSPSPAAAVVHASHLRSPPRRRIAMRADVSVDQRRVEAPRYLPTRSGPTEEHKVSVQERLEQEGPSHADPSASTMASEHVVYVAPRRPAHREWGAVLQPPVSFSGVTAAATSVHIPPHPVFGSGSSAIHSGKPTEREGELAPTATDPADVSHKQAVVPAREAEGVAAFAAIHRQDHEAIAASIVKAPPPSTSQLPLPLSGSPKENARRAGSSIFSMYPPTVLVAGQAPLPDGEPMPLAMMPTSATTTTESRHQRMAMAEVDANRQAELHGANGSESGVGNTSEKDHSSNSFRAGLAQYQSTLADLDTRFALLKCATSKKHGGARGPEPHVDDEPYRAAPIVAASPPSATPQVSGSPPSVQRLLPHIVVEPPSSPRPLPAGEASPEGWDGGRHPSRSPSLLAQTRGVLHSPVAWRRSPEGRSSPMGSSTSSSGAVNAAPPAAVPGRLRPPKRFYDGDRLSPSYRGNAVVTRMLL